MKQPRARAQRIKCPHCETSMLIKATKPLSPVYRSGYAQCQNPHCGASFEVATEIVKQISPSAKPNPEIKLQGAL